MKPFKKEVSRMSGNFKWKIGWVVTLFFVMIAFSSPVLANEKLIAAAKKEGEVVLYHSINRKVLAELAKVFEEKYGIKVKWTRKNSGGIARMIAAEKMAGVLKCDIVSNGDSTRFIGWKNQNLLTQYESVNTPPIQTRNGGPGSFFRPCTRHLRCNRSQYQKSFRG